MKRTIFCLLLLCSLAAARADDQVRTAQQILKDQGFFYGAVDGQNGAEISAAIKRYQIRNGLEVTGQLNQQTLSALQSISDGTEPAPAAPQPASPPPPQPTPATSTSNQELPLQVPPQQPPSGNEYAAIFFKTPYEVAPREVQENTLRRAQIRLNRAGLYHGPNDGRPGPGLSQAIIRYQADGGLPQTGRLDMRTLAGMDLLPRSGQPPEMSPGGRRVYRGIWIQ